MKTKVRSAVIACGALAISAGIAASPTVQAASVIDKTDSAGNTFQVSSGQDVVQPQFSLWPLGDNVLNVHTEGNNAVGNGNNTVGQPWVFGNGAGNVVQIGTGGNVVAPQVAIGVDNRSVIIIDGNYAVGNGNGSNTKNNGVQHGYLVNGNGNIFQIAFLQGNVINPQLAVNGDNYSTIDAYGNYAEDNGNSSNAESNGKTKAFVTGNGNIIQIEILSFNVINPQVAVNGSNNLEIATSGNQAYDNGNGSHTAATGSAAPGFGSPGLFYVYTTTTGNGNVTHIAILSHNVFAPQVAVAGPRPDSGTNTSQIVTLVNDGQGNGNESETETDNAVGEHQVGNGNTDQHADNSGAISNPQITIGGHVAAPVVQPVVQPKPEPEPESQAAKFVAPVNDSKPEPKPEPKVVVAQDDPKPEPKPEPKVESVKDDAPDMTTGNKVTPATKVGDSDSKSDNTPDVVSGNKVEPTVKADSSADSAGDSKPVAADDSVSAS
jgi:outer membrane biosynthesis protein TonB